MSSKQPASRSRRAQPGDGERTKLAYACAAASAKGIVCRQNQDRYRISELGIVLCDGAGGAEAGEVFAEASCWRCDALLGTDLAAEAIIADANRTVALLGDALDAVGGSAVCIAKFNDDGSVDIGSRGDVLAFRVNDRATSLINTPDYAAHDALASYLGDGNERRHPTQIRCSLPLESAGECLVFLTDGAWRSVSRADLVALWRSSAGDGQAMAEGIVGLAGRRGSLDDRTAIVCTRAA